MGRVVAIGERVRVEGFALAGVLAFPAEEPTAVRAAWQALPADTAVVVLTPAAAATIDALPPETARPDGRLTVVLPP